MSFNEDICIGTNEIEKCLSYELLILAILLDCIFYICVFLLGYSTFSKLKEKFYSRKNRKSRKPKF